MGEEPCLSHLNAWQHLGALGDAEADAGLGRGLRRATSSTELTTPGLSVCIPHEQYSLKGTLLTQGQGLPSLRSGPHSQLHGSMTDTCGAFHILKEIMFSKDTNSHSFGKIKL